MLFERDKSQYQYRNRGDQRRRVIRFARVNGRDLIRKRDMNVYALKYYQALDIVTLQWVRKRYNNCARQPAENRPKPPSMTTGTFFFRVSSAFFFRLNIPDRDRENFHTFPSWTVRGHSELVETQPR